MFSATKLVGIAAAVALFGALMLVVPLGPPDADPVADAPAVEPGEIIPFSGGMRVLGQDGAPEIERFDWGESRVGEQWTVRLENMSDARLNGVATGFHNVYGVGPRKTYLRSYRGRLFTKDENGTWLETGHGYQDPETTSVHYRSQLVGEGSYEGLFAIMSCDQESFSGGWNCEGVIFEGGLPELPEVAPDTIPEIHPGP